LVAEDEDNELADSRCHRWMDAGKGMEQVRFERPDKLFFVIDLDARRG
jgi:hypothetical protein